MYAVAGCQFVVCLLRLPDAVQPKISFSPVLDRLRVVGRQLEAGLVDFQCLLVFSELAIGVSQTAEGFMKTGVFVDRGQLLCNSLLVLLVGFLEPLFPVLFLLLRGRFRLVLPGLVAVF